MRWILAGWGIVAFALNALAASSLFDQSASQGEVDAIERSGKAAGEALLAADQLRTLVLIQQMQRGDCDPAFEIEAAAKNGRAKQQLLLAQLYSEGLCFPKDEILAARWLSEASKQGNPEASRLLALAFADGRGVEKNQSLAASYMRKAAEAADVPAMIALSLYLLEGKGVPQNPVLAVLWMKRAAATGNLEAHTRLGLLYLSGEGLPRDFSAALTWSLFSAERGVPFAQLIAGMALVQLGDLVEAYKWLNLASASEVAQVASLAAKQRIEVEARMAPSDLERARSLASAWAPKTEDPLEAAPIETTLPDYPVESAKGMAKEQALAELKRLNVPVTKDAYFDAAKADKLGVFILFHRAGASLKERWGVAQVTPLYIATDYGSMAVFSYLLENGANPNIADANGMTPLVRAIAHGRESMIDALLAKGATAEQSDTFRDSSWGGTPLQYALMLEDADLVLVKRLFDAGASVNERYMPGRTPLMEAVSAPPEVFAYLLQRGADPNAVDEYGRSVMTHFVGKEPVNIANLRALLRAGARVNWAGNELSPILGMVWTGNAEAVSVLIEAGAEVDIPLHLSDEQMPMVWGDQERNIARNGGTLLMMSVALGHAAVARELVRAGADRKRSIRVGGKTITIENSRSGSRFSNASPSVAAPVSRAPGLGRCRSRGGRREPPPCRRSEPSGKCQAQRRSRA